MLIKSLKLQNIRSYISQVIEFPKGSVLLAGDIGSGKSTILLAIEFALFGIITGTLSGDALLRNGKKEGSVELAMEVDGREVIVKRFLKKQSDRVGQNTGYIIIDGVKREATAQELKADILSILGYPKELLSKKNLVYRYTVYTPQEELKEILRDDREARLDTLRKLFGIDRYKRIRENSASFVVELKQRCKLLEGKIVDLDQKISLEENIALAMKRVDDKLASLAPLLKTKQEEFLSKSAEVSRLESDARKCVGISASISLQDALLKEKIRLHEQMSKDALSLSDAIKKLELELKDAPQGFEPGLIDIMKRQLEEKNANFQSARLATAKVKSDVDRANDLIAKVWGLEKCPTCLQIVGDAHKKDIHAVETEKSSLHARDLKLLQDIESALKIECEGLAKEYDLFTQLIRKSEISLLKSKDLLERQSRYSEVMLSREDAKKSIGEINSAKLGLQESLKSYLSSQEAYESAKKQLDRIRDEERAMAIGLGTLQEERRGLDSQRNLLKVEIEEKAKSKKQLQSNRTLVFWLDEFFVNLMISMEKHILASVHADFNDIFQKWFRTLIDDEVLAVSLDDDFTPVIEQNGYEVALENLSGGEKAGVALSYRLSLNRVINDFMSQVKTRDIIILDEPTDGFSIEQLDKVRDVIEALELPQVILVSHEPKIETFVDRVIRIRKEEHVSTAEPA